MTNWAGNVAFGAVRLRQPASLDELAGLVAQAPRVHAVGVGHSFSRVADTAGDLVSLARMPPVLDIDTKAAQVTVSGGTSYAELAGPLYRAGYGLASLASLPHLSVAGACATGTHGSGNGIQGLAAAVAGIELVIASGELVTLRRGPGQPTAAGRRPETGQEAENGKQPGSLTPGPPRDGGQPLAGAVVALGALGVVTAVTLDLVPTFDLQQYVYEDMPLAELAGHLEEVFAAGYSVSVFTTWQGPLVRQVWLKQLPARRPPSRWLGAALADGPRHPVPGASPAACTAQLGVPGPWHERLPHFRADAVPSSGAELQSEYLLPRQLAAEAMRAVQRIGDLIGPVLQVSELRVVAADDLWLSPSYHRDTVAMHFTWISDSGAVGPAISAVERELAPLGALPHWGKLSACDPATVGVRYQRAADFRQLRRELDPQGKFGNELTDRLFPAVA